MCIGLFSNVKYQDLHGTINLLTITDLEESKQSLKHLYKINLIGFLEKPGLNYCCKICKAVNGFTSFRLICFQIQTIGLLSIQIDKYKIMPSQGSLTTGIALITLYNMVFNWV